MGLSACLINQELLCTSPGLQLIQTPGTDPAHPRAHPLACTQTGQLWQAKLWVGGWCSHQWDFAFWLWLELHQLFVNLFDFIFFYNIVELLQSSDFFCQPFLGSAASPPQQRDSGSLSCWLRLSLPYSMSPYTLSLPPSSWSLACLAAELVEKHNHLLRC